MSTWLFLINISFYTIIWALSHGEGKFRNIPKKQKRRGHGGGKFRNMPKKQKRSWVWRRKIQKYTQEAETVVGMEG